MVFRLIAVKAYMNAVQVDHPGDNPPHFSKGCKVTTFIRELFSPEYATRILQFLAHNVKGHQKTLEEALSTAIIRFTHFGRMADDTGLTSQAMLSVFIRGMAIMTHTTESMVDLILPVLLRSDEPLTGSNISCLAVQIKLHQQNLGVINIYQIDHKVAGFFSQSDDTDRVSRPLVAGLGVQLPIKGPTKTKVVVRVALRQKPKLGVPLKGKAKATKQRTFGHAKKVIAFTSFQLPPSKLYIPPQPEVETRQNNHTHPRYSLFVYVCFPESYKPVRSADAYALLLANRDFLAEHPRQNEATLSAVRKMKPFWSVGNDCYEWVQISFLHQHPGIDEDANLEEIQVDA